jgi:hypothetical protein
MSVARAIRTAANAADPASRPERTLRCEGLRAALLGGLLFLGACAHQEVADLGGGRHALIAASSSAGFSGSHEEAAEQASAYCEKFRQSAAIDSFDDLPDVGSHGQHTSRVVFSCTAAAQLHF